MRHAKVRRALVVGSGFGTSFIWTFERSKIKFSLWFLTLSLCRYQNIQKVDHYYAKVIQKVYALARTHLGIRKFAWNPNVTLSQSRTSGPPDLLLYWSDWGGQFNPLVFRSASTAAITWYTKLVRNLIASQDHTRFAFMNVSMCALVVPLSTAWWPVIPQRNPVGGCYMEHKVFSLLGHLLLQQ